MQGEQIFGKDGSGNIQPIATGPGIAGLETLRIVHATDQATSVNVSGFSASISVLGDDVSDAVDSGSAPVKIGGIARQANPTAVSAGDRISATFDDLGRQTIRINQIRDLLATAIASTVTNAEVTLLAGVAGTFLDLIHLSAANTSAVAGFIDVRDVTGGNIIQRIALAANGTADIRFSSCPLPQGNTGNNWTIQATFPTAVEVSSTEVWVSALFSQEV